MNKLLENPEDSPIQTVLIVDDEDSLRKVVYRALQKAGFVCTQAGDAAVALELMNAFSFDLVISDIEMPGMDGIQFLKQVKVTCPDINFIIMTGYANKYSYIDIMNAGASDYMSKPFDINSMLARINRIAREKTYLVHIKKTNQELCAAIDRANRLAMEAKEASKAKTYFLASMSHEIRTPLNGIVGYTDMLMDTQLDEEQRLYLNNAKLSCETLLSVVNDILDFSKVEAGKLTLDTISFDPEVLCFETIEVVRTKVDESKVELICSVSDSVPGLVEGDPHRFRQVLLNLLSNAVKFTEKGFIKLSIDFGKNDSVADSGADNDDNDASSMLTISVKDSGIGIRKEKLDKIFEPFIQSENDITSRYGGTGLGLAISKNIARKMGGNLWADSDGISGTTFFFTSNLRGVPNKQIRRVRPALLKGKTVLLSAASEETEKMLSHEFKLAGMSIRCIPFSDLESFLAAYDKAGEKDLLIDVAVIDFGKMIKNQKKDLLDKIKRLRPENHGFDFIACSVPTPGIADIFCNAGFKGFLPKPVVRKKLFEMIAYVIGMDTLTPSDKILSDTSGKKEILTSHSLSENKKHGASILLVEDNPVNRKMTELMLTKAGYRIEMAENGQEAVDQYTHTPGSYDLILMDINMPVLNGFDATREIREFEKRHQPGNRIPILALTANVLDDFKDQCIEAGMDAFLTKPIKRELVFQAINQWVK